MICWPTHRAKRPRHEHLAILRRVYGYKTFSGRGARVLKSWLAGQAELARSNEDLARRFVERCRRSQTILPAISTIERLCADALVDAERRVEARIAERLNPSTRARLDALLTEMVDDRLTRFVWLRQFEVGGNSAAAVRLLERLAEGINLGLNKMAEASNTHEYWELTRLSRRHIESDAMNRALAAVVEAQAWLPMAQYWGLGLTASSDGQFFPTARQGEAMNLVNAKYGHEPGLKAYTHLSDQFAPFATQTIPATVHEARYILDGLLMNEAGRRVREQYADTGGFTDHVFAVTSLLGY